MINLVGEKMRKVIAVVLCFVMVFSILPSNAFAEETEQSLEDIIRPQVEAYAKSIDQSNADDKAANALAVHGISGKGKDLKVDESHALTVALVNSELVKEYFTVTCAWFISLLEENSTDAVYSLGGCIFGGDGGNYYRKNLFK